MPTRLNAYINDEPLVKAVIDYARKTDRSRNAVVRMALREFVNKPEVKEVV